MDRIVHLYDEVLRFGKEVEVLRKQRNKNASLVKKAGKMAPEERAEAIATGKSIKEKLQVEEEHLLGIEADPAKLPNFTHPDVPNVDDVKVLDMVDFENAAPVSGNKFYCMRNAGSLLELTLIKWVVANATRQEFALMTTPDAARESEVEGCEFHPRAPSAGLLTPTRLLRSDILLFTGD